MRTDPLEKDIQRAIIDYLTVSGIWVWRANRGAMTGVHNGKRRFVRFGTPGMSDIMGILPHSGRLLAIEVKRPGNVPTEEQQAFLDRVRENGGVAFWADSLEHIILEIKFHQMES